VPAGGVALFSFSLSEKMPVANLCLVFFLLVLFSFALSEKCQLQISVLGLGP
jgi:hypothetical protein